MRWRSKSSMTYGSFAVGDNVGCVKTRKYFKGEPVSAINH